MPSPISESENHKNHDLFLKLCKSAWMPRRLRRGAGVALELGCGNNMAALGDGDTSGAEAGWLSESHSQSGGGAKVQQPTWTGGIPLGWIHEGVASLSWIYGVQQVSMVCFNSVTVSAQLLLSWEVWALERALDSSSLHGGLILVIVVINRFHENVSKAHETHPKPSSPILDH
jgi:hypothetical protein